MLTGSDSKRRSFPIWQKVLVLLLLPMLFEVVFVVWLVSALHQTQQIYDQIQRSKKLLLNFDDAESTIVQGIALLSAKQYDPNHVDALFNSIQTSLSHLRSTIAETADVLPEVRQSLANAPAVLERSVRGVNIIEKVYENSAIPVRKKPGVFRRQFFTMMFEIKPIFEQMHQVSTRVDASELVRLDEDNRHLILLTAAGLLFSLSLSVWLSWFFITDVVRRLTVIQTNALNVANAKELAAPVGGADEIDELDRAFHEAAGMIADARRKEFAILENAPDVLFSLDKEYRLAAVGESARRAWRYQKDQLLGNAINSILTERGGQEARRVLELALSSNEEQEFEAQLKCGDGKVKDILWKVAWHPPSQSFSCVAHDISERRALEQRNQELMVTAGRALRVPLSAIGETLEQFTTEFGGDSDATVPKMLQRAQGNLNRLTGLLGDFLDLEKMRSDKILLTLERVSAKDVCATAIDAVSAWAQRAQVSLQLDIRSQNLQMLADRRRIEQILVNFLSNAIKFSPPNSQVTVVIDAVPGFVDLSVKDNGPGIEEAEIEMIFEKFYQSKKNSAGKTASTGLGLAICQALARTHGGTIGVESVVKQGSRFWIRIPEYGQETGASA